MTTDFQKAIDGYIEVCSSVRDNQIVCIDIETDGVDPFAKDTSVQYVGIYNGLEKVVLVGTQISWGIIHSEIQRLANGLAPMLVGHNIKFDWQFLSTKVGAPAYCPWRMYDTSIAEYLLTGQAARYISLDELATKYGYATKPGGVKDLLKQGVLISQMDKDMVIEYLKHDITTTWNIAVDQWPKVIAGMKPLVLTQMEALRSYIWMEINGMHFDRGGLVNAHFTCETQVEANLKELSEILIGEMGAPPSTNLTSNTTLSTLLWGEPGIKYTKREQVGTYKNGKHKYKNFEYLWNPDTELSAIAYDAEAKAHGCYDVSDQMLDKVASSLRTLDHLTLYEAQVLRYIDVLRDTRKIQKIDGTYFAPIIDMIDSSYDHHVHPTIHQTATHTGRTSASKPNSQNMPPVVRRYCTTRFNNSVVGMDGALLDSDFGQLEVCGLAQLCRDPNLISDIKNKIDIHYKTGRRVMGWKSPEDMNKHDRRIVKGVNFGIIYGGSAPTIAAQTGADLRLVKDLIKAFYDEYPLVRMWQQDNIAHVSNLAEVTDESPIVCGQYAQVSKFPSITGRIYTFIESEIPTQYRKGKNVLNFKPTEIKNYPVQGFATGDIVPIAVGLAAHFIVSMKAQTVLKLINVVHDSMLHDCASKESAEVLRNFLDYMVSNGLPQVLRELFGIELVVPFSMDHEIKTNW